MSRREIRMTLAAGSDIRAIASYLSAADPAVAALFEEEMDVALMRIAEQPRLGHPYVGIDRRLFCIRVSPRFRQYLIFYEDVSSEILRIVRVLHGARDLRNRMKT